MTQEGDQHVAWPHEMPDDGLGNGVGDDDFTNFLDLDNDFQQYATMNNGHSGLDTPMGRLGFGNNANDLAYGNAEQMQMNMPSTTEPLNFQSHLVADSQYGQYQQQFQQMQMPQQFHVPPTPVSAEMQAAKYSHNMGNNGQILFDHQQVCQIGVCGMLAILMSFQVSFTPLVSPAQTPLDGTFALNDFGLGDDFFSPLTSPAIEAQGVYTGTTASPVDLNVDQGTSAPGPTTGTKRPRRKAAAVTRTPRSVKQSPALKPHGRSRHPSLSNLSLDKGANVLPQGAQASSLYPSAPNSAVIQPSDDSVSPEPLSEAGMRPPPVPQPTRSPRPQVSSQGSNNPVTPATLMRMPSKQSASTKQVEHHISIPLMDEPMEDIMLPDPAASGAQQPIPDNGNVSRNGDDSENTPTLSAKTAKWSASSTPRSALTRSGSTETFAKPGKVESRGGRGSKKRQSTSSATISPALRPKISPSISPLVPATGK